MPTRKQRRRRQKLHRHEYEEVYIDPERRHVHFKETKVVRLGPAMSMWSLGINSGNFSPDGRTLSGEGTDEFGTYAWSATKSE